MTLQSRNRARGKATEEAVAGYLGWLRYGIMTGEDLVDPSGGWSGECKSTKRCVVTKWFSQAERNAEKSKKKRGGRKTPVLVIHTSGTHHETSDLAVIRLSEFKRLIEIEDYVEKAR